MTLADSPEEILAVNSPFSTQVIRELLSSTVFRRAGGGRPFPLLCMITVLKETRKQPDEGNVSQQHTCLLEWPPELTLCCRVHRCWRRCSTLMHSAAEAPAGEEPLTFPPLPIQNRLLFLLEETRNGWGGLHFLPLCLRFILEKEQPSEYLCQGV